MSVYEPKQKIKLKFRSVEFHTIEREVETAEFEAHRNDTFEWLDEKFRDSNMSDSDIETVVFELSEWER